MAIPMATPVAKQSAWDYTLSLDLLKKRDKPFELTDGEYTTLVEKAETVARANLALRDVIGLYGSAQYPSFHSCSKLCSLSLALETGSPAAKSLASNAKSLSDLTRVLTGKEFNSDLIDAPIYKKSASNWTTQILKNEPSRALRIAGTMHKLYCSTLNISMDEAEKRKRLRLLDEISGKVVKDCFDKGVAGAKDLCLEIAEDKIELHGFNIPLVLIERMLSQLSA